MHVRPLDIGHQVILFIFSTYYYFFLCLSHKIISTDLCLTKKLFSHVQSAVKLFSNFLKILDILFLFLELPLGF